MDCGSLCMHHMWKKLSNFAYKYLMEGNVPAQNLFGLKNEA